MKQNASLYLLIILLMTVMLAGCEGLESNNTSDWETYQNHASGYSIKYPSDCTFGELPPHCKEKPPEKRTPECLCFLNSYNSNEVFMQNIIENPDGMFSVAGLSIVQFHPSTYSPDEDTSLTQFLEENFPDLAELIPQNPNYEIAGIPAVRVDTPGSEQFYSYAEIFLIHDGKLFLISIGDVDNDSNKQFYETVLDSIEFSETSQ